MAVAFPDTMRVQFGKGVRIYTRNLTPGTTFFEKERTFSAEGAQWRELDPGHSKLGAAIAKGLQQTGLKEGSVVLYLGASHGYTPSFVSDIVAQSGLVQCIEIGPVVARDLVFVSEARENMIPILADARHPERFAWRVLPADVVFQDIAQPDQLDLFLKNCQAFLKIGGTGLLALKARSIDVTRNPGEIFKEARKRLETTPWLSIIDYRELAPFEKDHAFFAVKRRS